MIGRRRAVEMLFFWGVASSQFDAVGPRRPGIRHYHSQQRIIGLHIVRCPVLHRLRRHDILAMANGQLPLSFPRIMRLPHTLLMPAATSAATLIPRPVRLFREKESNLKCIMRRRQQTKCIACKSSTIGLS